MNVISQLERSRSARRQARAAVWLCLPVEGEGVEDSQRMVALLFDGLRYGAASAAS